MREPKLIEQAYTLDQLGLSVWCEDAAGPFQAVPHPGVSWQPREHPAQQPHEYIRGGTTKILTLFHPASGQVRLHPAARGPNAVLHPWLREHLIPSSGDQNPYLASPVSCRSELPHRPRHDRFSSTRLSMSAILAALPPPGSSQDAAATPAAWAVWQAGLAMPFTLP